MKSVKMKDCLCAIAFHFFVTSAVVWTVGEGARIPPTFVVDLDQPPRERWRQTYQTLFADAEVRAAFSTTIGSALWTFAEAQCDRNCLEALAATFQRRFPEYYEELAGMREGAGLTLSQEELVAAQFQYEFSMARAPRTGRAGVAESNNNEDDAYAAALQLPLGAVLGCTSVLTCAADGAVLHGRNLDWGDAQAFARGLISVNYTRGGALVFQSEQLLGTVGVLTGVRRGAFSLSLNARLEQPYRTRDELLACAARVPLTPVLAGYRHYLEHSADYGAVVANLTRTGTCAPRYSIVGGPRAGVRIQYNNSRAPGDDAPVLDVERLACDDNRWFVAQCNSDFGTPLQKDVRRRLVIADLQASGRAAAATPKGLLHAMSVNLVRNAKTIHTTSMSPDTGRILTVAYDS